MSLVTHWFVRVEFRIFIFDFFNCACLWKTTTDIRSSKINTSKPMKPGGRGHSSPPPRFWPRPYCSPPSQIFGLHITTRPPPLQIFRPCNIPALVLTKNAIQLQVSLLIGKFYYLIGHNLFLTFQCSFELSGHLLFWGRTVTNKVRSTDIWSCSWVKDFFCYDGPPSCYSNLATLFIRGRRTNLYTQKINYLWYSISSHVS